MKNKQTDFKKVKDADLQLEADKVSKEIIELSKLHQEIVQEIKNRKPKEEFKIFEGGNVKEMLKKCLDEGYTPANIKTIIEMIRMNKIKKQWYDTGTLFINGEFRDFQKEDYDKLKEYYSKDIFSGGARLLFVNSCDDDFVVGYGSLYYVGRFVGVLKKKVEK